MILEVSDIFFYYTKDICHLDKKTKPDRSVTSAGLMTKRDCQSFIFFVNQFVTNLLTKVEVSRKQINKKTLKISSKCFSPSNQASMNMQQDLTTCTGTRLQNRASLHLWVSF